MSTGTAGTAGGSAVSRPTTRSAKVTRTREVIDRVEIQHEALGNEAPVTTVAEQRSTRLTTMERGNKRAAAALPPSQHVEEENQSRRQRVPDGTGAREEPVPAAVEVPIDGADLLDTQELMAEAEAELARVDERMGDGAAQPAVRVTEPAEPARSAPHTSPTTSAAAPAAAQPAACAQAAEPDPCENAARDVRVTLNLADETLNLADDSAREAAAAARTAEDAALEAEAAADMAAGDAVATAERVAEEVAAEAVAEAIEEEVRPLVAAAVAAAIDNTGQASGAVQAAEGGRVTPSAATPAASERAARLRSRSRQAGPAAATPEQSSGGNGGHARLSLAGQIAEVGRRVVQTILQPLNPVPPMEQDDSLSADLAPSSDDTPEGLLAATVVEEVAIEEAEPALPSLGAAEEPAMLLVNPSTEEGLGDLGMPANELAQDVPAAEAEGMEEPAAEPQRAGESGKKKGKAPPYGKGNAPPPPRTPAAKPRVGRSARAPSSSKAVAEAAATTPARKPRQAAAPGGKGASVQRPAKQALFDKVHARKGRGVKRAAAQPLEEQPEAAELMEEAELPSEEEQALAKGARKAQRGGAKSAAKHGGGGAGQQRKRAPETYKVYLHRVSKSVHPELSVSKRSMEVLQSFTVDMFERLVVEAARVTARSGRETLSSREVQTAVKLQLPGALGRHAVAEGTKAVQRALAT
ncbi:hypothetical protein WJX81_004708 [Elliptochloris bilobata]|uniref:Core Histone H2A/H2B/H3 domain-containing protein n=1 Tax=Elliptochloris bilobata TaxID=381761 RepID=A0AAW1QLD1_9CHLO